MNLSFFTHSEKTAPINDIDLDDLAYAIEQRNEANAEMVKCEIQVELNLEDISTYFNLLQETPNDQVSKTFKNEIAKLETANETHAQLWETYKSDLLYWGNWLTEIWLDVFNA